MTSAFLLRSGVPCVVRLLVFTKASAGLPMDLKKLFEAEKSIRVLGIDDAHYEDKTAGSSVNVAGIVCGNTLFEGML